jgi:hypothetical protein
MVAQNCGTKSAPLKKVNGAKMEGWNRLTKVARKYSDIRSENIFGVRVLGIFAALKIIPVAVFLSFCLVV